MSILNLKLFFPHIAESANIAIFFRKKNQRYRGTSRQETLYKTSLVINRFKLRLLETTYPLFTTDKRFGLEQYDSRRPTGTF